MNGKAKTSKGGNHSKLVRAKLPERSDTDQCSHIYGGHNFQLLMGPFAKSTQGGVKEFARMYAIYTCVKCGAGLEVCIDMVERGDQ